MPKHNEESKSVLFVCLGNICRSPAAEGVLQQLVEAAGVGARVAVDSAGTSGYHIGDLADGRMRGAALQRGLELTSRARIATPDDLVKFDLVVAMDRENLRNLKALMDGEDRGNIRILSDYLDDNWPDEVPDPYYGGEDGFGYVLDMLAAACPKILAELTTGEA